MKAVGTRLMALCFIIVALAVQPVQAAPVGAGIDPVSSAALLRAVRPRA